MKRLAGPLLAVAFGTLGAWVPLRPDSCGSPDGPFPEPGIRQVWIRTRDLQQAAWRCTIRYSVPDRFAHGGRLPLPLIHRGRLQVVQAAAVDSAGNVSACWSNLALVFPDLWDFSGR